MKRKIFLAFVIGISSLPAYAIWTKLSTFSSSGVNWALVDGRSGASSGCSAQNPTALSGENLRPPWQVSGVDYAVGAPCDISFKDPATFTWGGPGVCDVSSGTQLRCDNVTAGLIIDGYDFTLGASGWTVILVNDQNVIIRNSKFSKGNIFADGGTCGLTIEHNTFDQTTADNTQTTAITSNCSGSTDTFRWNYFTNMSQHVTEWNGTNKTAIFKYNFINNSGGHDVASHINYSQFCTNINAGTTLSFNGVYQIQLNGEGGTGYQMADGCGGGITMTSPDFSYNTVVTASTGPGGTAPIAAIFYRDGGFANVTTNGTFTNNYFDDTGTLGGTGGGGSIGGGWFHGDNSGWTTCTGNFNMQDGSSHGC